MRISRLATATAIVVLMFAVLWPPATIAGGSGTIGSGDEAAYSQLFDVSVAEARKRLDLQSSAGALEQVLQDEMPMSFGGLWIEHEPIFKVYVYLTSGDAATLRRYVPAELSSVVEVRQATRTRAQLQLDAEAVSKALPTGFWVSVIEQDNEVMVGGSSTLAIASALGSADVSVPDSVRFIQSDLTGGPAADIYGGLPITACTSGFSVKQNGVASTGILTAAHCSDSQSYAGVSLTYKAGLYSGNHDEQWHTSTFTEIARFRVAAGGATRPVTSRTTRAATPVGGLVCKYGTTTKFGCGTLVTKSFDPPWVPNGQPTFMQVHQANTDLSTGGDSGGPVFLDFSAYGIVEGWWGAQDGSNSDLIYTAIDYPESWLGVTVITT